MLTNVLKKRLFAQKVYNFYMNCKTISTKIKTKAKNGIKKVNQRDIEINKWFVINDKIRQTLKTFNETDDSFVRSLDINAFITQCLDEELDYELRKGLTLFSPQYITNDSLIHFNLNDNNRGDLSLFTQTLLNRNILDKYYAIAVDNYPSFDCIVGNEYKTTVPELLRPTQRLWDIMRPIEKDPTTGLCTMNGTHSPTRECNELTIQLNYCLEKNRSLKQKEKLNEDLMTLMLDYGHISRKDIIRDAEHPYNLNHIHINSIPDLILTHNHMNCVVFELKSKSPKTSHSLAKMRAQLFAEAVGCADENYKRQVISGFDTKSMSYPIHGVILASTQLYFYVFLFPSKYLKQLTSGPLKEKCFLYESYDNKGEGFDLCCPDQRFQAFNAFATILSLSERDFIKKHNISVKLLK